MRKKYTKQQILENLSFWTKKLENLGESRHREGNIIYSDAVPTDKSDYTILGKEASVIEVNEWKKDKLYPLEHIEKCSNLNDLKEIQEKYKKQYLLLQWAPINTEGPVELFITPVNPIDFKYLDSEFGPNSKW